MHRRPMVEGDSVTGMQWIQKAIVAVAICVHCRPMVEGDSVVGMQCIQKANSGLKVYFWLWEHLCDQV